MTRSNAIRAIADNAPDFEGPFKAAAKPQEPQENQQQQQNAQWCDNKREQQKWQQQQM
mgnify:CR=1 FL=1